MADISPRIQDHDLIEEIPVQYGPIPAGFSPSGLWPSAQMNAGGLGDYWGERYTYGTQRGPFDPSSFNEALSGPMSPVFASPPPPTPPNTYKTECSNSSNNYSANVPYFAGIGRNETNQRRNGEALAQNGYNAVPIQSMHNVTTSMMSELSLSDQYLLNLHPNDWPDHSLLASPAQKAQTDHSTPRTPRINTSVPRDSGPMSPTTSNASASISSPSTYQFSPAHSDTSMSTWSPSPLSSSAARGQAFQLGSPFGATQYPVSPLSANHTSPRFPTATPSRMRSSSTSVLSFASASTANNNRPTEIVKPLVTTSATERAAHSRRTQPARFTCPDCGQTFTARHNLNRHDDAHRGIKRFPCTCGHSFTTSGDLNRHRRTSHCPTEMNT